VKWKGSELLHNQKRADDDAVVVRMNDGRILGATVDVFTPVVDDPGHYGQIAATNSMSDIYAMGGVPRFALSILGYPPDLFGPATPAGIIQGAVDKCWEASVVMAGGHTIKSREVMFGLAVVGDFPSERILEKGGGRPGDALVLTKPLGVGVLTTGIKRRELSAADQAAVIEQMCTLNDRASRLALELGATACTDITGFGFLGHLLEMVRQAGLAATVRADDVPVLDGARELAARGIVPGGTRANLKFVAEATHFAPSVTEVTRLLLADAQTSGGLLFTVPEDSLGTVAELARSCGQMVAIVGTLEAGEPGITVQ